MNLKEFLNYRYNCPICQTKLVTSFHSQRKQKIRFENNRFVVTFALDSLKRPQKNYKISYSFGLEDNSFYIDFYTKTDIKFENEVPLFLIKRFKELDKHLQDYKIYKYCSDCGYNYGTGSFKLNYHLQNIGELCVGTEYIIMVQPVTDGFKIYKLLNYYKSGETWLSYGKITGDKIPSPLGGIVLPNMIRTGIIPFITREETMGRIGKLLVFS
jgi:hypothetical protein